MLRQRVLTALAVCVLFLWALFFAPLLIQQIIVMLLVLGGAWEWSALIKLSTSLKRIMYLLLLLAIFNVTSLISPLVIIYIATGFWLTTIFLLIKFSHGQNWIFANSKARAVLGLLILLPFWVSMYCLLGLKQYQFIILLLLTTVIAADTGAYFIGQFLGKHKLAPAISPNKTIEGAFGGVLVAGVAAGMVCLLFYGREAKIMHYVLISVFTALFSILGDLLESAMKRQAKVKDSGNLLPGHGGILDRIDGYTAAAPFFTLMVYYLGG